ncbi:hypothetical protein [Brevundimonas sp. Root1423]|uniref:hypothetical protein n=1 Tax=Brevundimonas sp. Root1423 TaxID=1736462 RepID=UPI0006F3CB7C|nr:hypothetical protein [Brevundimonas sp. Root1423]KQY85081.1 hypothetical protein ASD25_08845 [Brevundimonas sp. Root1423]
MPAYVFHLHDGISTQPEDEAVTAVDLVEARDLAELRLLLGGPFTRIEVFEAGHLRLKLARDGAARDGAASNQSLTREQPGSPRPLRHGTARATSDMDQTDCSDGVDKGLLKPEAEIGEVRVENPPSEPLVMSPEEADVSTIRLLDADGKARPGLADRDAVKG